MASGTYYIALAVFLFTYIFISVRRVKALRIERPAAAMTGAALMVLFGVVAPAGALSAIEPNTIGLLLGMMLLVAGLELAGFFNWVSVAIVLRAGTKRGFMVLLVVVTAVLSALVLNDTVVLLFTPIVIRSCRLMKADPVPYMIAEALAANIGSVATEVGNPQNAYIASVSGIAFASYALYMIPVAAACLAVALGLLLLLFRKELVGEVPKLDGDKLERIEGRADERARKRAPALETKFDLLAAMKIREFGAIREPSLLSFLLVLLGVMFAGFVASSYFAAPLSVVALLGGTAVLLAAPLISRVRAREVLAKVDWSILLFFGGLFVVLRGVEESGLMSDIIAIFNPLDGGNSLSVGWLTVIAGVLSNMISNVPAVVLLAPTIPHGATQLWLALAASSTLAGNATLPGAAANIIVAEVGLAMGVEMPFWRFLKVGLPVTVVTMALAAGMVWAGI